MIFDTHCHLYDEIFNENVDEIIKRCLSSNVGLILLAGDNIDHSKKCVEISSRFEEVFCAVGIHPLDAFEVTINTLEKDLEKIITNKVKAIGEIGLDYYWIKEEEKRFKQKEVFIKQIDIANKLNLPVVIHARDSVGDCIKILKKHPVTQKGVFHCFSGSVEQMKEIIKLGFYIGLDGPVTYKNAIIPKEVAKEVPLERLVVETDSPYLPPVPHRGKINYPYYLNYIIDEIAKIKEVDYKTIEQSTFENGRKLFNI